MPKLNFTQELSRPYMLLYTLFFRYVQSLYSKIYTEIDRERDREIYRELDR